MSEANIPANRLGPVILVVMVKLLPKIARHLPCSPIKNRHPLDFQTRTF